MGLGILAFAHRHTGSSVTAGITTHSIIAKQNTVNCIPVRSDAALLRHPHVFDTLANPTALGKAPRTHQLAKRDSILPTHNPRRSLSGSSRTIPHPQASRLSLIGWKNRAPYRQYGNPDLHIGLFLMDRWHCASDLALSIQNKAC